MSLRFYLDENICQELNISYYSKEKFQSPLNVNIGKIIQLRNEWDDHHRAIMSGFVRAGRYIMHLESQGYGWFEIKNYPAIMNQV